MNPDLKKEAINLVAATAMKAAEAMPIEKRIMIQDGIMHLFPTDSEEWKAASQTAQHLIAFQQSQLKLTELLEA